MSVWADIHKRSNGNQIRKEDYESKLREWISSYLKSIIVSSPDMTDPQNGQPPIKVFALLLKTSKDEYINKTIICTAEHRLVSVTLTSQGANLMTNMHTIKTYDSPINIERIMGCVEPGETLVWINQTKITI